MNETKIALKSAPENKVYEWITAEMSFMLQIKDFNEDCVKISRPSVLQAIKEIYSAIEKAML